MSQQTSKSVSNTFLSRIRQKFRHEVYQDFQEYLYQKFQRPTLIYVIELNDKISICRPRGAFERGFCEFCRLARSGVRNFDDIHPCAAETLIFVKEAIAKVKKGEKVDWGWRTCSLGLIDLSLPIQAVSDGTSERKILGVLNVGNGRDEGDEVLQNIHSRIDKVVVGDEWERYFPGVAGEEKDKYVDKLHKLADEIPVIAKAKQQRIKAEISDAVSLMEFIDTRTLQGGILLQSEEFIQSLGLDKNCLDISENALWTQISDAVKKIIDYFRLNSSVIYISKYGDYTNMEPIVKVPDDLKVSESVMFPSPENFGELTVLGELNLPSKWEEFNWLDCKRCFGTKFASMFGKEMMGDFLIVIGFGYDKEIDSFQKAILHEAVKLKIFRFIENALFGIKLDHLMGETGHLLGRAEARVATGQNVIKEIEPRFENSKEYERWQDALYAIESGQRQLELIRTNFYSFRANRVGDESDISLPESGSLPNIIAEEFKETKAKTEELTDVITVIKDMEKHFIQESKMYDRLPLLLEKSCESAITRGKKDNLRLVFWNLFDNAIKFSYTFTYIQIKIFLEGNDCIVQFSNLGVGVAPDEQEKVFFPLIKSRFKDAVRRTEGLGLGLSYCRRIVETEFGGKISLESRKAHKPRQERAEGDNWITTVTVRLPMLDRKEGEDEND